MTKILIDEAVVRQALDASESFADGIYYENEEDDIGRRFCCGVLSYKPHKENCAAAASAAALRQTLANEALDKMAENARELGLSYEQPAQQDLPDVIAGALGVSRGTAYDMMREALAEQPAQQEPVAWLVVSKYSGGKRLDVEWNIDADAMAFAFGRLPLYTTPQAQPAQEPDPDELTIAYMSGVYEGKKRKPWVGLTDEDKAEIVDATERDERGYVMALVEAKLKEKNT